jgi:S1-C subfamily serine protease
MWNRIKQVGLSSFVILVLGIVIGMGVASPVQLASGQQVATPVQSAPGQQGATVVDPQTQLLRDIYSRVNPSVVSINVRIPTTGNSAQSPFGPQPQFGPQSNQPYTYAAGSGFVYDTAGHIVTNAHVVSGTDQVEIAFSDDTMMHAKIVGVDLDSDLAVIQAEGDISRYAPIPLADSNTVAVGDRAIAIGNPFQRSGTMTQGIVSGIHRSVDGLAQASGGGTYLIPDAIQTDAALNPGNSGGPLLNNLGQVIGVNEQIESQVRQSSGVSFAIPSNLVKQVADTLIKNGKIDHTWLGIAGVSLDLDLNEALKLPTDTRGAYVTGVQAGSPAAKAGLKAGVDSNTVQVSGNDVPVGGDIIIAVDGQTVRHFDDLSSYLFTKTKVGQTITLTVLRNGKTQDIKVTLAGRPHANTQ